MTNKNKLIKNKLILNVLEHYHVSIIDIVWAILQGFIEKKANTSNVSVNERNQRSYLFLFHVSAPIVSL